MIQKHETWGGLLAVDFFFAGMGGGMLAIVGLLDFFYGYGATSVLGNFLAPIFIILGTAILTLELGRPFQAWRVFMNPKSTMTVGSYAMTLAIIAGLIYASFGIDIFPWAGWTAVRKVLAAICVLSGLVAAAYPGVLLGQHKSRPFWTGAGMLTLFLTSSVLTGLAALILSDSIIPATFPQVMAVFPWLSAALLAFQFISWLGYVGLKRHGATRWEAVAARKWIDGDYATSFKAGILFIGTLLPLILFLFNNNMMNLIGAVLVLVGGFAIRMVVAQSGADRTFIPGEVYYRSHLAVGDEAFLNAWNIK